MTHDLAATHDSFADLSLRKQQLYRRYANGELSWYQVAEGIGNIKPPPPNLSRKQKIAMCISSVILAMLIPPWAKRED